MAAENMDFAIQITLDGNKAEREIHDIGARLKEELGGNIVIPITPDLRLQQIKTKIEDLLAQFRGISEALRQAQKQMEKVGEEASDAAKILDKDVKGAAQRVATAFEKGSDAAKAAIAEIGVEVKKATDPKNFRAFERAAGEVSNKWLNKQGRGASPVQMVSELLEHRQKTVKILSGIKKNGGGGPEAEFAIQEYSKQLAAFDKTVLEAFNGKKAEALKAMRAFAKMRAQGMGGGSLDPEKITGNLNRYLGMLEEISKATGAAAAGRGRVRAIAGDIRSNIALGKGLMAEQARGGSQTAKVRADPEFLIDSIVKILLSHVFTARIQADATFLVESIRNAVALANSADLKVNLTGAVATAAGEAAMKATQASYRNKPSRAEQLITMGEKDKAAVLGRTAEGVQAFLRDPEIAGRVTADIQNKIQDILKYYTQGGTPERRAERVKAATEAIDPVRQFLGDFAKGDASDRAKELMRKFGIGFGAEWMTQLEKRARTVRNQGPSRNPRGVLGGVDANADALYREQEWNPRYQALMQEAKRAAGNVNDLGVDPMRDRWSEQTKAYLRYQRTLEKYEKASLDMAQAQTMEHQRDAYNRVKALEKQIALDEAYLATKTLAGRGTVMRDGQQMGKGAAYLDINRMMGDAFGGALGQVNQGRSTSNQLSRNGLMRGLFGGDKGMAAEFLRTKGVTDDILNDEQLMSAELEKHIGHLRGAFGVWQDIEKEVRDVVKQLDAVDKNGRHLRARASAHGNAIKMDRARDIYGTTDIAAIRAQNPNRILDPDLAFDLAAHEAGKKARAQIAREKKQTIRGNEKDTREALRHQRWSQRQAEVNARRAGKAVEDAAKAQRRADSQAAREAARLQRENERETRKALQNQRKMEQMQRQRERESGGGGGPPGSPPMGGFKSTIRNAFALVGGIGIGYTAVNGIRNQMRTYMEFQQEIANIQGVLGSKNAGDAQNIAAGVSLTSSKWGADLLETAKAAKVLAQAGLNTTEVIRELDYTMAAMRGMGMTIEQVQELQVAVRAVTMENEKFTSSLNWTTAVLDKISAVEAKYAVSSQDLAGAIQILSPLMDNFSKGMSSMTDSFDYTIALTTVMVEKLRITGTQAANVIKMMFSRIARPEILNNLQKDFGLKIGDAQTGDFLPLDRMIQEMGKRYGELGDFQKQQFAVELSGGRNTAAVTTILEGYMEVAQRAAESANSFGDTQKRAAIASETMSTAVGKLKANFSLFVKDLLDGSGAAVGMKFAIEGMSRAFAAFSGQGMLGGGAGGVLTILTGGALFAGTKNLYALIAGFAKARLYATGFVGAMGKVARFFTPGGLLLAGLAATLVLLGSIAEKMNKTKAIGRYAVDLRNVSDPEFQAAPQYVQFKENAQRFNMGNAPDASNKVFDMVLGNGRGAFQNLGGEFLFFANQTEKDFYKWAKNNDKTLKMFTKEFVDTFIKTLPEESRKTFDSLKTDTEKIAGVVELVGGAAWSAAYQMRNAINDINDATQRMVDDTMAGMRRLDENRARRSIWDWITGKGSETMTDKLAAAGGAAIAAGEKRVGGMSQRERIMMELENRIQDQPVIQTLLSAPKLREYLEQTLLSDAGIKNLDASGGDYRALLAKFTADVAADPTMRAIAATANLAATGRLGDTTKYSNVILAQAGVDPSKGTMSTIQVALDKINTEAGNIALQNIRLQNGDTLMLEGISRALGGSISGGTPTTLPSQEDDANREAMARFRDALLDLTVSIFEAARKIETEAEWAAKLGNANNRDEALVGLGRTAFDARSGFQSSTMSNLIKLTAKQQELDNIVFDSTGMSKGAIEAKKLKIEIDQLHGSLQQVDTAKLGDIFGDDRVGQEMKGKFDGLITSLTGGDRSKNTLKEIIDLLIEGARVADARMKARAEQMSMMEMEKGFIGEIATMETNRLKLGSSQVSKMAIARQAAFDTLEAEGNMLNLQFEGGEISKRQLEFDRQRLTYQFEFNQLLEGQNAISEARNALDTQARDNLDNMLSGFGSIIKDTSIWDAILNPEGEDAEEKARNKAKAIGDAIEKAIMPIFTTITGRFLDNMMEAVGDTLFEMSGLKKILESPETKLKAELTGASMYYDMILTSSFTGAGEIFKQMSAGGLYAAGVIAQAMGNPAPTGSGVYTPGSAGAKPGTGTADIEAQTKKWRRDAMIAGAGMMIGTMGGSAVGGGGRGAQMGSQIGSTVGMMGASAIGAQWGVGGGPIGMAVGAAIGGLLGGLLGGKGDKDEEVVNPIVKGLEAIERAQRETINTITAQTDALLDPTNRLMNLPSGFSVPSFAQGGGNGRAGVYIGEINVPITTNAGPADIKRAVEEGVANAISGGRRNQGWN